MSCSARGLIQILPHPGDPTIYEPVRHNTRHYVELAERANGPIGAPAPFAHPRGNALAMLDQAAPDVRIINLETAVTTSDTPWPLKPITYRMHPAEQRLPQGRADRLLRAGKQPCVRLEPRGAARHA